MLKVNLVARSVFMKDGHGVFTAFASQVQGLRTHSDIKLSVDSLHINHDILHLHTFGFAALWRLLVGRSKKVITVHVIPESLVGSIVGARFWLPLMRAYMKFIYSRADLVLPVSPMAAAALKQMGIKKPIKVLYNGIEMNNFSITAEERQINRKRLGIAENAFVVLGNGQIQTRKRFDLFCDIAQKMPETSFLWVGGSPFGRLSDDYSHLQKLIDNLPKNVIVTGVIPYARVKEHMAVADVLWLPSMQENHPMAVLEAAGAGLPLLLRDISEYDDSFGDDIVRGNDETFESLLRALRDDTDFYKNAQAGARRIAEKYDNKTVIASLIREYEGLLNMTHPRRGV